MLCGPQGSISLCFLPINCSQQIPGSKTNRHWGDSSSHHWKEQLQQLTISNDIQDAAGPLHVCAWHLFGCEATVHAMRHVFEAPDTEAVLLVEASNIKLTNSIHHLCPALSKVLTNTYREDVQLFIKTEKSFSHHPRRSTRHGNASLH